MGGEFSLHFPVDSSCHFKFINSISLRKSEFLLLAPHCNNCCTSAEKKHSCLMVKSPGYEHIKICQPGVFQKHTFLTWITASIGLLYFEFLFSRALEEIFWKEAKEVELEHSLKSFSGSCKKFSLTKGIKSRCDTKSCVVLLCFLTCKYMGLRNLPLDLQYGYGAMQIVLLTPICHISPTFPTPTLGSSSSPYLRTNWLQRSCVR